MVKKDRQKFQLFCFYFCEIIAVFNTSGCYRVTQ